MNDTKRRRLRDKSATATTLVSHGCKINGVISGDCDFQVNGEVEGDCDLSGTVTLLESGHWKGTIKAHDILVSGHIEGDLIASGKVEIGRTARIIGTVTGAAIAVAEGAVVEGAMQTTAQEPPLEFVEKRTTD